MGSAISTLISFAPADALAEAPADALAEAPADALVEAAARAADNWIRCHYDGERLLLEGDDLAGYAAEGGREWGAFYKAALAEARRREGKADV
jgi:hypothetical protein